MATTRKIDGTVMTLRILAIFAAVAVLYRARFAGTPQVLFGIVSEGVVIAALLWGLAAAIQTLRAIESNTRQKP